VGIVVCADQKKSDVWIEDASIASIIIHLTAASLGLGSCWIQIRKRMHNQTDSAEGYIADVLKLPADLKILSIIGIGYSAEQKPPHEKEKLLYSKIHREVYGGK
jgi:nitroreductase